MHLKFNQESQYVFQIMLEKVCFLVICTGKWDEGYNSYISIKDYNMLLSLILIRFSCLYDLGYYVL